MRGFFKRLKKGPKTQKHDSHDSQKTMSEDSKKNLPGMLLSKKKKPSDFGAAIAKYFEQKYPELDDTKRARTVFLTTRILGQINDALAKPRNEYNIKWETEVKRSEIFQNQQIKTSIEELGIYSHIALDLITEYSQNAEYWAQELKKKYPQ